MKTLGTLGNRIDLSHSYAAGSYQLSVEFAMFGLRFKAQRFVRTDTWGGACDNVDVYAVQTDTYDEYIGRAAGDVGPHHVDARAQRLMTCPVARRALHLLAVAESTSTPDCGERFAAMEF